jgi:hypothetical protein
MSTCRSRCGVQRNHPTSQHLRLYQCKETNALPQVPQWVLPVEHHRYIDGVNLHGHSVASPTRTQSLVVRLFKRHLATDATVALLFSVVPKELESR